MAPSESPELTDYAKRLPARVLTAHMVIGIVQITVGIVTIFATTAALLERVILIWESVFAAVSTPLFFAAGATGLDGGWGRRGNTQCRIIWCLLLSILSACLSIAAITAISLSLPNSSHRSAGGNYYSGSEPSQTSIFCIAVFAFELPLALLQVKPLIKM